MNQGLTGDERTVTLERDGHVALIGLQRAHKYNSFTLQMLRELAEAYDAYEADDELRCAVLFGRGTHFTTGLDLAEVGPAVASGAGLFPDDLIEPLDLREPRRTKPVIAAVHGWCLTIGVELLLACDMGIAARDTRLAQMEVKRGIMPFGAATIRLPQRAGWGNAMRWLLTGGEFDADEALKLGLVQEVTDPGKEFERALELAREVAAQAPLAVRASRLSARTALEQGGDAAVAVMVDAARELMGSEDALEGLRSFMERREAQFRGR